MSECDLLGVVPALVVSDADFALGLCDGRESYEEDYAGEALTDTEVMQFIERNLSQKVHEKENRFCAFIGLLPISYTYRVGFVVGWLGALMGSASVCSSLFPLFSLVPVYSVAPGSLCATRQALTALWQAVGGDLC